MDVAAPHDMGTDSLLQPSVILSAADGVSFHLRWALHMLCREIVIVLGVIVFAKGDSAALTVRNLTVLNNPALAPMRAYHAVLESCRRRPGRSRLLNIKSAHGNVASARLFGEEAASSYVNFDVLFVRVRALEVRVQNGLVAVLLAVPLINRVLRLPRRRVNLARDALLQRLGLIQHPVIQIYGTRMSYGRCKIPVTVNLGRIRVVIAEDSVRNANGPDILIPLILLPAFHLFRARNDRTERLLRAVHDSCVFRAASERIHVLSVNTLCHDYFVARHCNSCRIPDALEGACLGAVAFTCRVLIHIINHRNTSRFSEPPMGNAIPKRSDVRAYASIISKTKG